MQKTWRHGQGASTDLLWCKKTWRHWPGPQPTFEMFALRFRALEVPMVRVRKSPLSLAKVTFSSLWEQALPVPKKKSTPQNGENGLVQWPTLPHIALWIVRLMLEKDCFFILKQDRNPWIKYDVVILTQSWSWFSSNIYWWFEEDKISEMEKLGLIVWRQWRLNWKSVGWLCTSIMSQRHDVTTWSPVGLNCHTGPAPSLTFSDQAPLP